MTLLKLGKRDPNQRLRYFNTDIFIYQILVVGGKRESKEEKRRKRIGFLLPRFLVDTKMLSMFLFFEKKN